MEEKKRNIDEWKEKVLIYKMTLALTTKKEKRILSKCKGSREALLTPYLGEGGEQTLWCLPAVGTGLIGGKLIGPQGAVWGTIHYL